MNSNPPIKKGSPLKEFLEKRKGKLKKNEYSITMTKGETMNCDTCGKAIFSEQAYSGCVCMGEDMDSKIHIKKSETGVKIRFPKQWDPENIEMLLEVLRKKRG
jgi:predicted metal-binding protein